MLQLSTVTNQTKTLSSSNLSGVLAKWRLNQMDNVEKENLSNPSPEPTKKQLVSPNQNFNEM